MPKNIVSISTEQLAEVLKTSKPLFITDVIERYKVGYLKAKAAYKLAGLKPKRQIIYNSAAENAKAKIELIRAELLENPELPLSYFMEKYKCGYKTASKAKGKKPVLTPKAKLNPFLTGNYY